MPRSYAPLRCDSCGLREIHCVCAEIPKLDIATKLVVIMHHREVHTTSNTGRLAVLAFPNAELRIRGLQNNPARTDDLMHPDRDTLLMYPSDDAHLLTPEFVSTLRGPVTLVVPDGSWRQASKVGIREMPLKPALRVKLPPGGPPTEYHLRREPKAEGLATLEAIARALGVLESKAVQESLEAMFRSMVRKTLVARGQHKQYLGD